MDDHSSHFNPEAIKIAAEAEIIIFCLPPHTTHVAQPLDVSFFGPLKGHWSKVCHSYMTDNPVKVVTKFQFCSLLNKAWFKPINSATIISGFRKMGVCPFNATAIQPYAMLYQMKIPFLAAMRVAVMRLLVTSPLLRKMQNL